MGTNNQKRISVCIAAYRPNDYLLTELESIMPQLSDCDEVIISEDNHSGDKLLCKPIFFFDY
ncbi:hypothetical protein [Phocaeicola dorei]|uniref:hypothetical protein n=1 Tax=Phocaeicola dorei TaxID=357276 RepID=UPI0039B6C47C